MPEPIINFIRSSLSPYFPYSERLIPIVTANRQGPAISPIAFERSKADSANADAHCAIESSDAPAHIISSKRFPILIPCPSSAGCSMGQVMKLNILYSGIIAQIQASHFQLPIPNTEKNTVESRITPTEPQQ